MKSYFQKMYQYEFWANMEVWRKVEKCKEKEFPNKLKAVFSHLITAQKIWLARLQNVKVDIGVWDDIAPKDWKLALEKNYEKLQEFIDKQENFSKMITYQNSKGDLFETSIEDILQHLLLHAAYHRGQIVMQLKTISIDLPTTDYIFYVRS